MALFDGVKRLIGRIRDDFFGPPEPPRLPPPEPPELPEPSSRDERMREEFENVTGIRAASYNGYDDWRDLYLFTGITSTEDNEDEIIRLWGEFLEAFYLTSSEGSIPRDDWYGDSGLGPDRIDWELYREIKRT